MFREHERMEDEVGFPLTPEETDILGQNWAPLNTYCTKLLRVYFK
jgi:hypothetical protein